MGTKDPTADKSFPQDVTITNTQAHIYDSLRGAYGSTRGDVMNKLMFLGLEHLRGKRTLQELQAEARAVRAAAPDVTPKPPSRQRKKDDGNAA